MGKDNHVGQIVHRRHRVGIYPQTPFFFEGVMLWSWVGWG